MLTEIIYFLGKLIASSAMLYAFYWIVLRKKASYKTARIYLLLIPFICIIMSGLTLKVLPNSTTTEESSTTTKEMTLSDLTEKAKKVRKLTKEGKIWKARPLTQKEQDSWIEWQKKEQELQEKEQSTVEATEEYTPFFTLNEGNGEIILYLWGTIALILVIIAIFHIISLYVMSRKMKAQKTPEGYMLIRSPQVPAPCSFAKTIFMPTSITDNNVDLILRHEKAHILHAHFIDVWVMEIITRLLWFNPFIWMTRNELRNVHEFEADHDVICSGADMSVYQTLLLEQVMDNGSSYANGFNHSFIRRRFIEMKHSTAGSLGRIGKLCMGLWVTLLFCGFTFAESDPTVQKTTVPEQSEPRLSVPELSEPQLFTLEGRTDRGWMDEGITDSTFYIYLGDDYMHINTDKPATKVTLKNGTFHYEIPLTKVTAARIQNAQKGSAGRDFFFVPGEKAKLYFYSNNAMNLEPDDYRSYVRKLDRSIFAIRNTTDWQSPNLPKLKGKRWENVTYQSLGYPYLMVKEVFFNKDETILRIAALAFVYNDMIIRKESYLTDDKGRIYKLRRALYGNIADTCSADVYTFGGYYAFDPVPEDVKELNFMDANNLVSGEWVNDLGDTIMVKGANILHIKKAPKRETQKPNFQMDITVSQGINDSGYLIEIFDNPNQWRGQQVADIPVVDRKCSFATYVDEPKMAHITATFPDGSVCSAYVWFPFVPGEKAVVKVKNGTFELSGTSFYEQWGNAGELVENAGKYHKEEETQALLLSYLKEHINEEGCVMRFWQYEVLPREEILKLIPVKIKNGRFKKFFAGSERHNKNRN